MEPYVIYRILFTVLALAIVIGLPAIFPDHFQEKRGVGGYTKTSFIGIIWYFGVILLIICIAAIFNV